MNYWIQSLLYGTDLKWKPVNRFLNRQDTEQILQKLEKHMRKYCYYCNDCDYCTAYIVRCTEFFKKMAFGPLIKMLHGEIYVILCIMQKVMSLN